MQNTSRDYVNDLPLVLPLPYQREQTIEVFVLEIRKKDGSEYVPNTLHHIVAGIMRHIRLEGNPSIDFFKDAEFANFHLTLDGEIKRLSAKGIGGTG